VWIPQELGLESAVAPRLGHQRRGNEAISSAQGSAARWSMLSPAAQAKPSPKYSQKCRCACGDRAEEGILPSRLHERRIGFAHFRPEQRVVTPAFRCMYVQVCRSRSPRRRRAPRAKSSAKLTPRVSTTWAKSGPLP
jgi:hypothetical protein